MENHFRRKLNYEERRVLYIELYHVEVSGKWNVTVSFLESKRLSSIIFQDSALDIDLGSPSQFRTFNLEWAFWQFNMN